MKWIGSFHLLYPYQRSIYIRTVVSKDGTTIAFDNKFRKRRNLMDKKNQATARKGGTRVQQLRPKTNPALERLDNLAGEWNVEMSSMSFHPDPSAVAHGRVFFEWLEGGIFMIQREEPPGSEVPHGTWIIGPDDAAGTYGVLHYDSRGVSRIYQMSLNDGVWKVWRDFPGFSQRFTGTFSKDAKTITAHWKKSNDGSTWEHDFDLTYTKVG
jgi:hypothetical protein